MKYRALMFDIDGTLIDGDCLVSDRLLAALRKQKEKGILLCINSGRPLAISVPFIGRLFEGLFDVIIGSNGSEYYLCSADKFYVKEELNPALISEIYERFSHESLILGVYENGLLYTQREIKDKDLNHWLNVRSVVNRVKPYDGKGGYPKVLGLHARGDHEVIREFIKDKLSDSYKAVFSSERVLEIVPVNVSKALGVKEVAELLKCKEKEIICFGDGDNDAEMLEAGYGVVMGNGVEHLKQRIGRVIGRVDEDGLAEYLERL